MKCTISVDKTSVAIVDTSTHNISVFRDNRAYPEVRVWPSAGTSYGRQWVPIAECGELAEGLYVAVDKYGFREVFRSKEIVSGEADVTHVLNPHIGPIPDAPESEEK